MKISLKSIFAIPGIAKHRGKAELEIQGTTLRDLLEELSNKAQWELKLIDARTGNVANPFRVSVNDSWSYSLPQGLDTELRDGDEIEITAMVVAGG